MRLKKFGHFCLVLFDACRQAQPFTYPSYAQHSKTSQIYLKLRQKKILIRNNSRKIIKLRSVCSPKCFLAYLVGWFPQLTYITIQIDILLVFYNLVQRSSPQPAHKITSSNTGNNGVSPRELVTTQLTCLYDDVSYLRYVLFSAILWLLEFCISCKHMETSLTNLTRHFLPGVLFCSRCFSATLAWRELEILQNDVSSSSVNDDQCE